MLRKLFTFIVLFTICAVAPATANMITLEVSGIFGPGVTLNNTTDLADVAFTYRALFNTADNSGTPPGNLISPASVEFTINSVIYSGANTYVYLDATDPITPSVPYTVGLSDENQLNWQYFLGNYTTITTPFNAADPQNSFLSGTGVDNSTGGLSLTFDGGATLSNLSFGTGDATATFTPAVPEPSTYALLALGFGGMMFVRRRKACA